MICFYFYVMGWSISMGNATGRTLIAAIVVFLPSIAFLVGLVLIWKDLVSAVDIMLLVVMYLLTLIGVEGGFHRLVTHNAFKTYSLIRGLFVIFGSMASQGPVIFWAATHRKHHEFTDEAGDPHSPILGGDGVIGRARGFLHGHCGWLFANEIADWGRYAPDLIRDRALFRLNNFYPLWVLLGLLIPTAIGGVYTHSALGALTGFLWGGLIRIFAVHHVVWGVNSLCHIFGSQPFYFGGNSRNNLLLVLPSLGGALHNNHHAFPRTANNAYEWWQFDFIGLVIKFLGLLGWAWDIHEPSRDKIIARKNALVK